MKKRIFLLSIFILSLLFLVSCQQLFPDKCKNGEHKSTEWVVEIEATCTTLGKKSLICTNCKETITTSTIAYKEHTEEIDEEIKATCTEDGLTSGSHCSVCKIILVQQEVVKATGHHYEINESKSTDEKLVYECIKCSDSYEKENTSSGECANGHTESDWITVSESTCIKNGSAHKICIVCEIELFVKTLELAKHTEEVINGFDAKCEETGKTDGVKCLVCGTTLKEQTIIPELGHEYEITKTLDPTEKESGYIEYSCIRCDHSYIQELAAIGDYNPLNPTVIILSNNGIKITNNNGGVKIEGNQVIINLAGEYDLSGEISNGSVKIALPETDKATINLRGVNLTSTDTDPIFIESGDVIDISAKADTINYISDLRTATTIDAVGGAIYSKIDLDIKGKGTLIVKSTYNNGIATTKDLEIQNLTLEINAVNNALKGNDSIIIESGTIKAISSTGDALKTENSDVSDKGNQRGIIKIIDGTIDLFAACDGIDSSYDVIIDGGTINIYTEKYSNYSGEVTTPSSSKMYLRISSRASGVTNLTKFSALFILEDGSQTWANGTSANSGNRKYFLFNVPTNAKYVKFFAYSNSEVQGQSETYSYATDQMTINTSYDTLYINSVSSKLMKGSWENYSAPTGGGGAPGGGMPGGGGGPMEGNPDSATYSCKGIKADNSITINGGNINIKSHDDAIHTNSDVLLSSGSYGKADLTVNGGTINLYTDDDGIHSDGVLTVNGGNIIITNSYEGIEGNNIYFKNGEIQIKSSDDGINAKTTLYFQGAFVYLDAGGDGIDSNGNIYMSAGVVLALGPTNGGNGVIDYGDRNASFSFTGGLLLAIGCSGMNAKPTGSTGNTVSATTVTAPSVNSYLTLTSNGKVLAVIKVTKSNQNYRVLAYNNSSYPSTTVTSSTNTSYDLTNGLYYIAK